MAETHEELIDRVLRDARETPRVLSFGEEGELLCAYGQIAAARLAVQARQIPNGPAFDHHLAKIVNLVKSEIHERIVLELHGVSFRALGPARNITGAIMVEVNEALQAERAKLRVETAMKQSTIASAPQKKAAIQKRRGNKRFSKRAIWLKEELRVRAWSKHDLQRFGGPDNKTTQKVLDGLPVRDHVLDSIAQALSKKGPTVTLLQIPNG